MKRLSKQKLLVIIVFNLVIAVAYYIDNLDANYSELSSDIQNIIPVAQKFDNPALFQEDLYLDNIENVKYYTPFYVQTLRFMATFTNYNYIQAVNVLGFICHLSFGILWFFLLFRFVSNFWVALLVSILIRGIIWLPGLEIWGISDLWTIMPRTVYISLLPLPFLIFSKPFYKVLIASFLIGLIFNFHPITGLGGVLLFLSFIVLNQIYFKNKARVTLRQFVLILAAIALGMLPFVLTYFGKTSSEVTYNLDAFEKAFHTRIPDYFSQPFQFLRQWLQLKTLFFIIPLILFFILSFKNQDQHKKAKLLVLLTVILILIPTISVPVEQLINKLFGLNLRLSFQLIRVQKVAVIPAYFAWAFIFERIINANKNRLKYAPYVVGTYLVLLVFSQSLWFNKVPFFGEDISKTILPHNLSVFSTEKDTELAIDRMSKYINKNTNQSDVLCASYIYRGATKRSVIFDGKGASMLIEGNPQQFIEWQKRQETINSLNNMKAIIDYLKQFNVDYYVTRNKNVPATLIHTEGSISLYKL
ncbi:hypothetical protein [Olleya sp. YS]|uniref:hypothetical protein n=1 Tax=Olleya sp. YS TaxID=3028318 RepID=UPI00243433A1|nr:hypothetical protein [Olleya sp. YS]WGD34860.1 hypothetical protein Ollyesu_00255 [Olleya sp. YS]